MTTAELRSERARRLLEETDLKIHEICEAAGYSGVNHFNRIFERITGVRPSRYRKDWQAGPRQPKKN